MLSLLLFSLPVIASPPGPVAVTVEQTTWRSGEEIRVRVSPKSPGPIWVPGCDPVVLEIFDVEHRLWRPLERRGTCVESEPAKQLPAEGLTLTIPVQASDFTVARLVVVYGLTCVDGFPLEMSACVTYDAALSSNLSLIGKGD